MRKILLLFFFLQAPLFAQSAVSKLAEYPYYYLAASKTTVDEKALKTPKHPIILVAGIGGSQLKKKTKEAENIWLSFSDVLYSMLNIETGEKFFENRADNNFREFMVGKYSKNGLIEPVFTKVKLGVPYAINKKNAPAWQTCKNNKLEGGLCGIEFMMDILDGKANSMWDKIDNHLFGNTSIGYFGEMIDFLAERDFVAGKDLFGFPYDWRLSNRNPETLSRLDETLRYIYETNGNKKIDIISHSMGCLVVKLYMVLHKENATKYINSWVAIGGPFQGAAGDLLAAFLSGYALGDPIVCNCTARELVVQMPSSFELLPSKWMQSESPLSLKLKWKGGSQVVAGKRAILDLISVAYSKHTFSFGDATKEWPLSNAARTWAKETHELLEKNDLPGSIKILTIYGTDLDTGYNLTIPVSGSNFTPNELLCESNGCHQNSCLKATASCEPEKLHIDGDGTVPSLSASHPFGDLNNEPDNLTKHAVPHVSHQELVKNKGDIFSTISSWLKF